MISIGGYFASLDLKTNAAGFEAARKYLTSITVEADIAAHAMDSLQKQMAKNASSFGFGRSSSGGGTASNAYQQMRGFKVNPVSGYMVDDGNDKEEKKRADKKDYLNRIASLYVMIKLLSMLKDVAVKLANLTYAMTQANMKAYTSAVQANMSAGALKAWSIAADLNAQDSSDMISRFTTFNKAFAELKIGKGEAFGAIAQDVSLLGKGSGMDLDPKALIGMSNDERVKAIFNAAKQYAKKDMQTAIRLLDNLLGPGAVGIMINDLAAGTDSLSMGYGATLVTPSAKDVQVGQQIGLLKESLGEMSKLLGQMIGEEFYADIKAMNEWLRANKDSIKNAFAGIADALHAIYEAFKWVVDALTWIDTALKDVDKFFDAMNPFNHLLLNDEQKKAMGLGTAPATSYPMAPGGYAGGMAQAFAEGKAIVINNTIQITSTAPVSSDIVSTGVKQALERAVNQGWIK